MSSPVSPRPAAFTLIELLVSMAVLLILVLTVTQLTNSTSSITSRSQSVMDSSGQARLALDRLDADLKRVLRRKDLNYIFAKPSVPDNNDAMFFYSESPGYFTGTTNKSPLALVGYRINKNYQLERLGKSLSWDGSSPSTGAGTDPGAIVFLSYAYGTTTPLKFSTLAGGWPTTITASNGYKDGTDTSYRILESQAFRLETCFQLKRADGTCYYSASPILPASSATPTPSPSSSPGTSVIPPPAYDTTSGSLTGMPDELVAVVTTIATIDEQTRAQNPGIELKLAAKFVKYPADASQPNRLPAEAWQALIDGGTLGQGLNLTQATVNKIHVYQRVAYLNPL